jgi:hypothetical protein
MRHRFLTLYAVVPALAVASLFVQIPPRQTDPARTPPASQTGRFGILAEVRSDEQPIRMQSLKVRTHIVGMRATTVMETVVFNPNNRVLEGTFSVPLIDGQVVVGMALDINGTMRDAVVVDKTKGRSTFEAIQRRGVDPALVEWTRDNAFKTRVYPILPQQQRVVRIVVEQDLVGGPDGFVYTLPMTMTDTVQSFVWDVHVDGFGSVPSITGDGSERIMLTGSGRTYTYHAERKNVFSRVPLVIDVPVAPSADVVTVNEWKGERVLSIAATSPAGAFMRHRPTPSTVAIVWDASYSQRHALRDEQFHLIRALFTKWQNVVVRVDVVAHDLLSTRQYTIRNGDVRTLLHDLESMPYDGATNLGAVPFQSYTSDVVLVFSDGVQTYGAPVDLRCPRPTYCIAASSSADHDRLRVFAQSTGGELVNLVNSSLDDAVHVVTTVPLTLEAIRVLEGHVDHLYPSVPVRAGLGTTITGRLKGASASLELIYALNGVEVETRVINVHAQRNARDGAMAVRQWAAHRVARLAGSRRANADSITALGLRYGIVTPRTSLLVLETLADYLRYDIEPPDTEPALRAEWNAQRVQPDIASHTINVDSRVDAVVQMLRRAEGERMVARSSPPRKRGKTFGDRPMYMLRRSAEMDSRAEMNAYGDAEEVWVYRRDPILADEATSPSPGVADDVIDIAPAETAAREKVMQAVVPDSWTRELSAIQRGDVYAWYLRTRVTYDRAPGYFIDVADRLRTDGDTARAHRVLSNLAELDGENHRAMRILGRRLMQWGLATVAVHVFRDVLDIRDEEPQSYRDLALAMDAAGRHQEAVDMLYAMALRTWDDRFPEVQLVALNELNRIRVLRGSHVNTSRLAPALLFDASADVRVVMDWDADNSDMDLMITEPDESVCYYGNRITKVGRLSRDLVGGYGPEEYMAQQAAKGKYIIRAKYYGDRQQQIAGATTVQVAVFRNYARSNETVQYYTLRLRNVKEHLDIAEINVN